MCPIYSTVNAYTQKITCLFQPLMCANVSFQFSSSFFAPIASVFYATTLQWWQFHQFNETLTLRLCKWKSNSASTMECVVKNQNQIVSFHLQMECNRKFYDETCIHTKLTHRIVCIVQITIRLIFPPSIAVIMTLARRSSTWKMWVKKKLLTRYFCHPLDALSSHCVNLLQCTSTSHLTWQRLHTYAPPYALSYLYCKTKWSSIHR